MNVKLNEYKNWLERRNLSHKTIELWLLGMKKYGSQEVNTDNIVNFLKENLTKYSPYYLKSIRNSLSAYAKFQKIREIEWEIISRIIPKVQPRLFPTVNYEDLEKLKSVSVWRQTSQRDNLILDFLFYIGLRVDELVNIKHSDYQDGSLSIHGKGNKFRFVPVPSFLIKHFENSNNYLFKTRWGKKLSQTQVRKMIYWKSKKIGLNKHISPHTFRRSFATLLNNKEVRLNTIQKLLGHNDINTTNNYIHNSYEEILKDYSRLWKTDPIQL